MLREMPKWFIKAEEKLEKVIMDIVNEENINVHFVLDSKIIENAKSSILMALVNIQEQAEGNVSDEFHKEFKKEKKKNETLPHDKS